VPGICKHTFQMRGRDVFVKIKPHDCQIRARSSSVRDFGFPWYL
jgi:hypothetical protein